MTERMILTIGLIGGTGNLGPGLALRWASAGYRVIVGSRSQEKADGVAEELNKELGVEGIQAMENREAVENADICVLTVNHSAHSATIESLKEVLAGKILIDATARVDFQNPHPPASPSAPEIARDLIGKEARVVAAFQTIPAHVLRTQVDAPLDYDVLVCSDHLPDAEEVMKLIVGAKLNPYFAGPLENAVVLEGMTALLIAMNKHHGSKRGTLRVQGVHSE